tara:strand:+ start:314 stop:1228 length:915 start_codon:yes stop_codon:yes gene_type:complete
MININVINETAQLKSVIVGIADDFGGVPNLENCYDPKSKEHVLAGTFSKNKDCIEEIEGLVSLFEKYNIKVYRPSNIINLNQIFARDIAFVIKDKLVVPNIIEERKQELNAIDYVLDQINDSNKINMPLNARVEGGDVILCNKYIFVGYSEKEDFENYTVARTNKEGLDFLINLFPDKIIKGMQLNKSDEKARDNALHLDCCFQPIGKNMAILYKGGFKYKKDIDFLINYFGEENIIEVDTEEMYNMNVNVFSISENVVVSDTTFVRLNMQLRRRGFTVEEVNYSQIGKMSGLLRCSTMPLIRK